MTKRGEYKIKKEFITKLEKYVLKLEKEKSKEKDKENKENKDE